MDGHKQKKLTKKQAMELLPNHVNKVLKNGFAMNMQYGSEIAYQMMLDYINDGHNLDEVKSFIEKNLSVKGKEAMSKVLQSETIANEESN